MTVLDVSVVIAHLDATDAHHQRAAGLLVQLADRDLTISPITLAEVLIGPVRAGRSADVRTALDLLEVVTTPLPADAPLRLATLRVETGLRLPDCCVLLAAQQSTREIATFDDRLTAAAERLGLTVRH